jgi:hypothetical protein
MIPTLEEFLQMLAGGLIITIAWVWFFVDRNNDR